MGGKFSLSYTVLVHNSFVEKKQNSIIERIISLFPQVQYEHSKE